jgi:deoxyuridine 5'-triphosphate nucleotidohydrolase
MDHAKTQAIDEWKVPWMKKELQSFLGFANYYQRFIEGHSGIVKPLTTLTGKALWNWKEEEQEAFNKLKHWFHNGSILSVIQREGKLRVEVDTSQKAMGGVLTQLQHGEWKTITFWSQAFSEAERNYDTSNRELNVVISALKHWRQYLVGTKKPFEIWTDHQNLLFWSSPQNLIRRHARWVLILADYDFTLYHIPRDKNKWANALSRMPQYEMGENDNDQTVILPPAWFHNLGERKREVLKVKRSSEKAKIPTKGSKDAAGHDLYSIEEKTISKESQELISTGIHISILKGTYTRIAPRSGLATWNMIGISAGVIDEDYQGEVKVLIFNHGHQDFHIKEGDRIAQLILEKIKDVKVIEVEELEDTTRGSQGFGSSRTETQELRRTKESTTLEEDIWRAYQSIPTNLTEKTLTNPPPTFTKDKDSIWYWQHWMIVPNNKDLWATVIRQYHDHKLAGHPGIYKTHKTLTRDYWWPTVKKDVQEYVKGCATCQRVKPRSISLAAPLHPNEIPDGNWTTISTDIIGPLPEAHGYNAINIIVDRKSKLIHFIPTMIELSWLG